MEGATDGPVGRVWTLHTHTHTHTHTHNTYTQYKHNTHTQCTHGTHTTYARMLCCAASAPHPRTDDAAGAGEAAPVQRLVPKQVGRQNVGVPLARVGVEQVGRRKREIGRYRMGALRHVGAVRGGLRACMCARGGERRQRRAWCRREYAQTPAATSTHAHPLPHTRRHVRFTMFC